MTSADFAAAQARIAHRRAARQADLQHQQHLATQQINTTALIHLPAPLRQACTSAWSQWSSFTTRQGTQPAFRVGQVDAELLDEELLELLKGQVEEAFKYYGQHIRNDWHAEIQLALRTVLFKLTIWDHDASYGAALQNLRYSDARKAIPGGIPEAAKRWQKALYGLISVGGRYGWGKWNDYLLDVEGGYEEPSLRMQQMSRFSNLVSTTYSLAAFTSFLVFLLNGKYRTLLDRLLRLRLTPTTSQVSREVSFEYLNRQLVWHAFTEFLLFLLPLVGISRWRRWIARAWKRTKLVFKSDASSEDEDARSGGELGFLPERTCAICYQDQNPSSASEGEMAAMSAASSGIVGSAATDVTNPYEAVPCGCVYCFVCIAQRLEAEDNEGWTCLRCAEIIKECRPWSGDVVIEQKHARKSSSSSAKSNKRVSFLDDHEQEEEGVVVDESFTSLDPMPVDDEKIAGLSYSVSDDASHQGQSLDESAEWSRIGLDDGPLPDGADRSAQGENDGDVSQALDPAALDAIGALVDASETQDEDEHNDQEAGPT